MNSATLRAAQEIARCKDIQRKVWRERPDTTPPAREIAWSIRRAMERKRLTPELWGKR